ncbi:UMP kinase [Mycoplasma putrefaciens]|uniref:Uridylate kinase n=2 Tax=Mycoplasma putrefaciens TaxID=2123 RepID=M9WHC9_9MOLU|nr:UMP kinase [Mycoplasma putrefaciens]AEM68672.1 UMP kinase [Mycoplasma putrefaciens KS1]AGJ90865.1 Uridylate kinase [Mycoplasma putrefaciens Mput9231]
MKYKYQTILLKLSGEALKGDSEVYDKKCLENISRQIIELARNGLRLAIVVGGGNIWRGKLGQELAMPQINADYMGMLATVMNGLALESTIRSMGYDKVNIYSSLPIQTVTNDYNFKKARIKMSEGYIAIFVGGTGYAYFTTDTNAVIRAYEIQAEAILMAKNGVKGVYDKDPRTHKDAKFIKKISHQDVVVKQLGVMDLTAAALAKDANLKIEVFDMSGQNNIIKVLQNQLESTIIE